MTTMTLKTNIHMWLYKKNNFNILLYYVFFFLVLVFFSCTSWKNMWIVDWTIKFHKIIKLFFFFSFSNYEVKAVPLYPVVTFFICTIDPYGVILIVSCTAVTDKIFSAYIFIVSISRQW